MVTPVPDERARVVIRCFEEMKSYRQGYWDSLFQQCKDVVWPDSTDFQRLRSPGQSLQEFCYDGTAPQANIDFANIMQSSMANPFERWFKLQPNTLDQDILSDFDVVYWNQVVSDIIYQCYSNPSSNHKQSIHEANLSQGCFGTGVVYQEWDDDNDNICFQSIPLAECFMRENHRGLIDTLYREVKMTYRQMCQRFGEENLPANLLGTTDPEQKNKLLNKEFVLIHCVEPRQDRRPNSPLAKDMAWCSDWVIKDKSITVYSSGFKSFPYHVPRWHKISGQTYGRSPAMTALPTIKVLNQTEKARLQAEQKEVNPPMILPHDSFMSDFDMRPGALNFYDSAGEMGPNAIRPVLGPNSAKADDSVERKQAYVNKVFYADMASIPFKKERQTEMEISARQDDMLRSIAPLVGRQESEFFGPMLSRSYELLQDHKKIPPHPAKLVGSTLKIVYISRAAFAQKGGKLSTLQNFITNTIVPMAQVAPEIKDRVDMDMVVSEAGELSDVTYKIFRTDDQVAAIRKSRADAQAQQQQMQAMESGSTALKNVGAAAASNPQLAGSLQ